MNSTAAAKWIGLIAGVLAIAMVVATGWWYFQDDKLRNEQWYIDDNEWNTSILAELALIKGQLASMEQDIIVAIDRHEEFVSVENRDIKGTLTTSLDDLSYRLGVHAGQHMKE